MGSDKDHSLLCICQLNFDHQRHFEIGVFLHFQFSVYIFTSYDNRELTTRVRVEPSKMNGLTKTSYIMVERIVSVRQKDLGEKIGELEEKYL